VKISNSKKNILRIANHSYTVTGEKKKATNLGVSATYTQKEPR
jgi:hypothetical protein